MRLLLDTHTFLWWDAQPERLSDSVRDLLTAKDTTVLLSLTSVWEIQIKHQIGKLSLRLPLSSLISEQQNNIGLMILPIHLPHIYALEQLPHIHRDPFDRMIIAQALVEGLPFASADSILDGYPIQRIW